MANSADIAAITEVVHTYAKGMVAGDRAALERVFFEDSCEVGHFNGELLWNTRDAFITLCEDEADTAATAWWEVRTITVHGDIAVAHAEDEWAGMRFDTILTLLKHDGAWRVVSKVYRVKP